MGLYLLVFLILYDALYEAKVECKSFSYNHGFLHIVLFGFFSCLSLLFVLYVTFLATTLDQARHLYSKTCRHPS